MAEQQTAEDTQATAAEAVEAEAGKTRGRPSKAELDAREARLAEREAELLQREREIELAAAEANLLFREAEAQAAEQKIAAARTGGVRNQSMRAEEVRPEAVRDRPRRRFRGDAVVDKFYIPPEKIPPGMSYQWNTHTVMGAQNMSYDVFMAAQGWTPVDSSRHPELVPEGYKGPIIIDGQILVERPMELTKEAQEEDRQRARDQMRIKQEQLYGTPQGQFPRQRANGTNDFIRVNRNVEPGEATRPNYQYVDQGGVEIE